MTWTLGASPLVLTLALLSACAGPGPGRDDDDTADDDDSVDDDDSADDDDSGGPPPCATPEATESGHDLESFVVSAFGLAGPGDWEGSPCLQAVIANDHAPNKSPGGRCVFSSSQGFTELSNSLAGGGESDDLEVNLSLTGFTGSGTYVLSGDSWFEVRVGQADGEWVHWVTSRWGGQCSVQLDGLARTGRATCTGLTGRYGPEPDEETAKSFGVYDVEATWSCPEVSPP